MVHIKILIVSFEYKFVDGQHYTSMTEKECVSLFVFGFFFLLFYKMSGCFLLSIVHHVTDVR